ncbi:MAG TPA: ABC transporter permease [Myxococcaceae bacterium]|nr:ABC transporter permease [Myxococcaceae bacterium]
MRAHDLAQDLRLALRALWRAPAFTLAVLATLALGIGASTAIFSVIHGVLLSPLPYRNGERLVHVTQPARLAGVKNVGLSPGEVRELRGRTERVTDLVEYHSMPFVILGGSEPQRVQTGVVSAGFFQTLGVRPLLGRLFQEGEDLPGAPPVLLLSYKYWQKQLGGDPAVIGRSFTMNDRVHTVVGVLPNIPQYPAENDVYMPLDSCPFRRAPAWDQGRAVRGLTVFGHVKPDADLRAANAELAAISAAWQQDHPAEYPRGQGLTLDALSLRDELTAGARPTLLLLLAAAAFLLLIVCTNVANLTLARLQRRERELAVRTALGASRGRMLGHLLSESVTLAVVGGGLGLALAMVGLPLLVAFVARLSTRAVEVRLDGTVLAFNLVVSVATGVAVGALPALRRARDLSGELKDGSGAGARPATRRARSALVVAQVAISSALLIGAGLFLRSLHELSQVDPGVDVQHVQTARVGLDFTRYGGKDQSKTWALVDRLVERLSSAPGTVSVGVANAVPLRGSTPFSASYIVEGQATDDRQPAAQATFNSVTPEYFRTLGVPVVRGRAFTRTDRDPDHPVVVVNQSLARHRFGAEDPLGRRLSFDGGKQWVTIVGVVGDTRQQDLTTPVMDEVIGAFAETGFNDLRVFVRSQAAPVSIARQIRETVHELDPQQPITEMQPLSEQRAQALAPHRLVASLLGLFAALALVITASGLIGVVAYSVSQRTREIGVRLALGAAPGAVLRMVLGQGMALVLGGLCLGLAAALVFGRLGQGLLFGVGPLDPLTYATVAVVLLAISVAACALPARQATRVDPMLALRAE